MRRSAHTYEAWLGFVTSAMKLNELESEYAEKEAGPQAENLAGVDATVPRVFLDDEESTPGHIQVMFPFWIYTPATGGGSSPVS